MKPEIKKQIILHLPYLAFVYLFGKVGQAFRLAQGADLSAKLLHIGQGFSAAFASAAPSFHPTDLLIGLAAAVIIRLVVYDITKHPRYKYLSDADKKNTFDVERYIRVQRKKKKHPSAVIAPEEPFDLYEIELSDEDADFTVAE